MSRICVSFSGMQLYDTCPSAFQRKYILMEETDTGDGIPSPAAQRGIRVHRGVELYLKKKADDLPDEALAFQILFEKIREERAPEPERHWAFTPEWEETAFGNKAEAQVRGILDIAYEHDGVAHVKELKTGKVYDEHALQRSLYGLAGMLIFPETEHVQVDTIYLDGAKVKPLVLHRSQEATYKYVWQRYINGCQPPQPYPQRKSWKCRFCDYHEERGGTCNGKST